jgi:membrane protein involved in colicin uptake
MTAQIDPLELLNWIHDNPEAFAAEVAAGAAERAAEKAARDAAFDAADAAKKAAYAKDGFFFNNLKRRYDCARCSGRGVLQQYTEPRHRAGFSHSCASLQAS